MNKLPEPFKTDWIKALRSGEYKQGQEYLYRDGAYCCLGVAEKVCGTDDFEMKGKMWPLSLDKPNSPLASKSILDVQIFTIMNDEEGKSFSEIADYIEQNL